MLASKGGSYSCLPPHSCVDPLLRLGSVVAVMDVSTLVSTARGDDRHPRAMAAHCPGIAEISP